MVELIIIYNIPQINDFNIIRVTKRSLQIQNTLNNIFQLQIVIMLYLCLII